MSARDPLFLLLCRVEWHNNRNVAAYMELVAALDDPDPQIRDLAKDLIHRTSPRPACSEKAG